jgi:putative ABC transport system permease protein
VIRVALRGLLGRKLRAVLTALAVVLGVAMISGTYVLTDTIDKAFNAIFEESYAGTDAVVTGQSADISLQGLEAETPPVAESLLADVRRVDGVDVATGSIFEESAAKIVDREGKAIDTAGAPALGIGIDTSPELSRFNPLNLLEGRWPAGPDEVVIDAGTADDERYGVGDRVGVASLGPVMRFEVVGIARYGSLESLGTATFAVFDVPTAQQLFDREGSFDGISVAAREGVTPDELVRDLRAALPDDVKVQTGVEQAAEETEDVSEFTTFIRYFLLAFGGIALFVGAFVIFNTLSITVAQRTREFATLRTIGASRAQILRSVIVEALVIGILASIIGLFLGFALAEGLQQLFIALDLDLPTAATVYAARTVVVSLLVGVVVTLLAGLAPAVRATRVPPIAAVREGSTLPHGRFARFTPYVAGLLIVLALVLLGYAMFVDEVGTAERLLAIAGGVLALFVGVAMIASHLVSPLARVVGIPARAIGGAAGRLAHGNSIRNPGRTAATAAALMIGLALVTFIAVLSDGMKASNREAIEDQIAADYVVTSQDGFTPFVAAAGDAIGRSPVAQLSTDVRSDLVSAAGSSKYITGIDPGRITEVYNFDWQEGSDAILAELGSDGAVVDDDFAEDEELAIGDRFSVLAPSGERAEFVVRGIYEPPPFYPLLGSVSILQDRFDDLYERPRNQFTLVNVAGDPSPAAETALTRAAAEFPDAKVQTREDWITKQDEDFNQFLLMLYVLLALSVIVSLFGMVNTLVLSVFERTRELGMLRAVGMTRRQVRRMIRHESVITALIGAALGLPLGIFLAALVTKALSQFEVQFSIPIGLLVVFTIVAILAGVAAAIVPARRAARLRVLEALQYE